MDWITEHQNEEKAKKIAEAQAKAAKTATDEAGQRWIGALLESRLRHSVEQVNQRLGRNFNLVARNLGYGFIVSESRKRPNSSWPSYDWFEIYCFEKEAKEITLSGNKGRDPNAMPENWTGSPNDWTGEAWMLKVQPRGPQLLQDEDIDALFQWLVVGTSDAPELLNLGTEGKNYCFVATAVYGAPNAPELETLRFFRDELLLPKKLGRFLVERYYQVGLPLSQFLEKSERAKKVARLLVVAPIVLVAEFCNAFLVRSRCRPSCHQDGKNQGHGQE
jgi:hypothetical protein